jgi:hypothetical protein
VPSVVRCAPSLIVVTYVPRPFSEHFPRSRCTQARYTLATPTGRYHAAVRCSIAWGSTTQPILNAERGMRCYETNSYVTASTSSTVFESLAVTAVEFRRRQRVYTVIVITLAMRRQREPHGLSPISSESACIRMRCCFTVTQLNLSIDTWPSLRVKYQKSRCIRYHIVNNHPTHQPTYRATLWYLAIPGLDYATVRAQCATLGRLAIRAVYHWLLGKFRPTTPSMSAGHVSQLYNRPNCKSVSCGVYSLL